MQPALTGETSVVGPTGCCVVLAKQPGLYRVILAQQQQADIVCFMCTHPVACLARGWQ
jgi:hypothetical protein